MADNKDFSQYGFEPISDEELAQYGFEPEVTSDKKQYSIPESMLKGAEQGATLGFADELSGAIGAGLEGTTMSPEGEESKLDQLQRVYKEYRDLARGRYKEAEEQNPKASFIGNLAGGFAIPGGKILQGAKEAEAALAAQKAMSAGKIAAKGAGLGALAGAGGGAGASEAELMQANPDIGHLAADTASGSALGAGLGATAPFAIEKGIKAGKGLKKILKLASEEVLGPSAEAFKQGMKGNILVGEEARRGLQHEAQMLGEQLAPELMRTGSKLAVLKQRIIERASKRGVKLDPDAVDAYLQKFTNQEIKSNLPRTTKESNELQDILRTASEGPEVYKIRQEAIPGKSAQIKQIQALKRAEQEAIQSGVNPEDIDTVFEPMEVNGKMAAVVRQMVRDQDGNPLGYKKLASKVLDETELGPQFKDIREKTRAGGRDLTDPKQMEQLRKDISTKSYLGDEGFKTPEVQRQATEATESARDMIRDQLPILKTVDERIAASNRAAQSLGFTDSKSLEPNKILDKLTSIINKFGADNQSGEKARRVINDFMNNLKIANPKLAAKIEPQIEELASKIDIAQTAAKPIYIPRPLATAEAYAVKGGNLAGYGIRELTPETMRNVISKLANIGTSSAGRLAEVLRKASQQNMRGQKAIMYGIMQNPEYRDLLRRVQDEFSMPEE